jgi:response regulator RpfG family c-di-GMP phosphodiesterase
MSERVLFIDDEPQILEAIRLTMRKRLDVRIASTPADGMRVLLDEGPFAVVVSDMRMPQMNGAQFLSRVREASPESVRMILTGQADIQAAISAVNDGHIFRFLNKPCPPDQLFAAITAGFEQYRLTRSEKVLLEETLSGAVKMLIEILGMVSPAASSRASRLQRYVKALAAALELREHWQWPLAALISQIGCVALPKELLSKVEAGQSLSEDEKSLYQDHPEVAGKLLATIPRLEEVAAIVAAQCEPPKELHPGRWRDSDVRTVGQALLYTAREFDSLVSTGMEAAAAANSIATRGSVPPDMARALENVPLSAPPSVVRQVKVRDLAPGMVLDEDLVSSKGIRIMPAGNEVTRTLIVKLASIASGVGVAEPFRVRVQI